MQDEEARPPAGFEPLFRRSPFLDTVGPFFYRKEPDGGFILGLRILPKHVNARGTATAACCSRSSTWRSGIARRSAKTRRRH